MSGKIVVPRWFDEWYRGFDVEEKPVAIYYLAQVGFGSGLLNSCSKEIRSDDDYYINKNREKLIRAMLDGYEVDPEYIEVSPVEAYERYFNDLDVYVSDNDHVHTYKIEAVYHLEKINISEFKSKFYIKKENE